jgi:hypothetical protein
MMILRSFEESLLAIGEQSNAKITVFTPDLERLITAERIEILAANGNINWVNRVNEVIAMPGPGFEISMGEGEDSAGAGVRLQGFDDLAWDSLFGQEVTRLVSGSLATQANEIIIHQYLAMMNGVSVGDSTTFQYGEVAAEAIVAAIDEVSRRGDAEVLILARGGGSIEDLWSFNDERVARVIRRCAIPVVTGIGHEIDFTIADFAADVRAPTPSGAAEIVVPDQRELLGRVAALRRDLVVAMQRMLARSAERQQQLATRLQRAHPGARLRQHMQRLDELELRLRGAWENHRARLTHRLQLAQRGLNAVSPLATLERGYAIVTGPDGVVLQDAAQVQEADRIQARLAKGQVIAQVVRTQE